MGDTHNTTLVLQDYNTWADQQRTYDVQVHSALTQIGNNVDTYNHEIARDQPDIGLLQENVEADRQTLDAWGTSSTALGSATDTFTTDTASLDFGSDTESSYLSSLLAQDMKIYSIDMGNARQHFIDYNRDLGQYLTPDDPDYWDDSLRMAAMDAKARALSSVEDGNAALSNITATAQTLQQRQ
jgi:ABC-type transporter Mla subunit MlaD